MGSCLNTKLGERYGPQFASSHGQGSRAIGLAGDLAFANLLLMSSRDLIRLPVGGGWAEGAEQVGGRAGRGLWSFTSVSSLPLDSFSHPEWLSSVPY